MIARLVGAVAILACFAHAQALNELQWRSVGPASIGGRISAIEGVPGDPTIVYAATGSGGLFRSDNAGTTWRAIFEKAATISIGDIAIDPKHPDDIWVGTGEANLRNSVSFGSGVYRSRDAGKTWENRGLAATMTISRIQLDPRDPQRVFVAAVGHPFGPNPERGVFFSPDAGATWQKVLYIDERHGASDLEISPGNPDTMFAGMWQFDRKPWRYDSGGTSGGLYRSLDAGRTWNKVTRGLPALMGRIGVKVAPGNPRIVYVVAESREGTLFRSYDGGESFEAVSNERELAGRGYYYCDLRVDPKDENRVYVLSNALMLSTDAGKTFTRIGTSVHGDLQALWIDPQDPRRMWQGSDGGLASSWDAGRTWQHTTSLSLGQFYHVASDDRKPFYNISGGTQDNGTWTGPSRTREPSGILNDDWRMISPIVGFNVLSDLKDPDLVLTQTPGGALLRTQLRTREQQNAAPQVRSYGGSTADEMKYRFAWDAPLVRSPHGDTIYYAGNVLFQSSDLGRTWEAISRDLSKADRSKMRASGGPVFTDNSSSETYGAITRLAESPAKRGVIWAGTDDGNVQVTVNGGGAWSDVSANLPGVSHDSPVSSVEASRFDAAVAYVALDRHMFDDTNPWIFRTADGGKTWKKIVNGLPAFAVVWVIREDPKNARLLYAGTETGLFASWDAGEHWSSLALRNLPNVAVRDVVVRPENNDILLATHGRGLWIIDDATPVQMFQPAGAAAQLFPIRPALRYTVRATRANGGDTEFAAANPPYGALVSYALPQAADAVKIEILDGDARTIRVLPPAPKTPGVHRVAWDLRAEGTGALRGPQVLPGTYRVRITAGAFVDTQIVQVQLDPELHVEPAPLQAQWDALTKISAAIGRVNGLIRQADQHTGSKAWQEFRATLARPKALSAQETGPRLLEQLQSLFNLVDSANDAPSAAMTNLLAELTTTLDNLKAPE